MKRERLRAFNLSDWQKFKNRVQNAGNCIRTQAFLCTILEVQIGVSFVVCSLPNFKIYISNQNKEIMSSRQAWDTQRVSGCLFRYREPVSKQMKKSTFL